MEEKSGAMRLTYSCVLVKDGKRVVQVTMEGDGKYAEAVIPGGKISRQRGFDQEELEQIKLYLKLNEKEIFQKAKEITGWKHWFS